MGNRVGAVKLLGQQHGAADQLARRKVMNFDDLAFGAVDGQRQAVGTDFGRDDGSRRDDLDQGLKWRAGRRGVLAAPRDTEGNGNEHGDQTDAERAGCDQHHRLEASLHTGDRRIERRLAVFVDRPCHDAFLQRGFLR